jgi:hypothetical protein
MNDLAIMNTDGFAVQENTSASMIVGKMLKFSDGRFTVDKTETLPANVTLVAVGVITAWVRWEDSRPSEHKVTQPGQSHPYRDELPDQDTRSGRPASTVSRPIRGVTPGTCT